MKNVFKKYFFKVLSGFLSFLMVFYLIPTTVFAEIFDSENVDVSNITPEPIEDNIETAFELTDRREESVKHFQLNDGSIIAVQYASPVHRKDDQNNWEDIDNRLQEKGDAYTSPDARVKFSKKIPGNEAIFTLHEGNKKITFSLNGAIKKTEAQVVNQTGEIDGNTSILQKVTTLNNLSSKIRYSDILKNTDLEYLIEANNIKETAVNLVPNGRSAIEQLKFAYNSSGRLALILNPHSNEAVVLRYSNGYMVQQMRAHGTPATTWNNWVSYANNSTSIPTITADGYSVYGYSSGYLNNIRNEVTDYEVTYLFASAKVYKINESAGINGSETTGQSVWFSYGATNTTIRTSGADDLIGNNDDLFTIYNFDELGRTVGAYTTDVSKTNLYGASSGQYVDDNEKAKNSIKSSVQTTQKSSNYLLNGGFETLGNPIPHWTTTSSNNSTIGTTRSNTLHGEGCVYIGSNQNTLYNRSISQTVELPKGDYSLSLHYRIVNGDNITVRMSVDSEINSQDASKKLAVDESNAGTAYQFAGLNFSVTPASGEDTVTCTVKIEVIHSGGSNIAGVYIDDVMLSKTTGASDYDMSVMGHFETTHNSVVPNDVWSFVGGGTIIDSNGLFGHVAKIAPVIGSDAYAEQVIYQVSDALHSDYSYDPSVNPGGKIYTISGWGKGTAQAWADSSVFAMRVKIRYYHYANGYIDEDPIDFEFDRSVTDWQYITGTFATDASKGLVESVTVQFVYQNQPGIGYFDQLSVLEDSDISEYYTYTEDGHVATYQKGPYFYWYIYDENGNMTDEISRLGHMIEYTYDSHHRLTDEKYINFESLTVTDDALEFDEITEKYRHKYIYDSFGLMYRTVTYERVAGDAEGEFVDGEYVLSTYTTYDTNAEFFGAIQNTLDVTGNSTKYYYDQNNGRLLAVIYPEGNGVCYRYDAIGNLIEVSPAELTETNGYAESASNSDVEYTYDASTKRLSKITTASTVYAFTYDVFGNTTSVGTQSGSTTQALASYTYNPRNGKLNTMTYGNGLQVKYVYDELDRIEEICYNTGTGGAFETAYTYSYDTNGMLFSVEDHVNNEIMVNEYDLQGRIVRTYTYDSTSGSEDFSIYQTYDQKSRPSSTFYYLNYSYPGGVTHEHTFYNLYSYSTDGDLSGFTIRYDGGFEGNVSLNNDNFGRLTDKTVEFEVSGTDAYCNNVTYTYKTAAIDRATHQVDKMISTVKNPSNNTVISSTTYEFIYDKNGNIIEICDEYGHQMHQYYYDDLGQLIRENNFETNRTYIYEYDAAGNRITNYETSVTFDDTETLLANNWYHVQYERDRLIFDEASYYSAGYDAIGNMVFYSDYDGNNYSWQGRQMVGSYYSSLDRDTFEETRTLISSYTYNADGIRTSKTIDGITHEFILNGSQIIAEKWTENSIEYMMLYLYDEQGAPIGLMYRTSQYAADVYDGFFFEKNYFGDIVAIYNESGTKIGSYVYDAWGNMQTTVAVGVTALERTIVNSNPFRYRGYYYDTHTALYYLQSRYYDPALGRFISPDGYINANGDILGYNMYLYCSNNPVMFVDPNGESILAVIIGIAGLGGTLIGLASCAPNNPEPEPPKQPPEPEVDPKKIEQAHAAADNAIFKYIEKKDNKPATVDIVINLEDSKNAPPSGYYDYYFQRLYDRSVENLLKNNVNVEDANLMSISHMRWEYTIHYIGFVMGKSSLFYENSKEVHLNVDETYVSIAERAMDAVWRYFQ